MQSTEKKKGYFLNYRAYKKLERIIEDYNLDENGEVDFRNMKADEKEVLWQLKTVIRNMESVRLRNNDENKEENHD